MAGATEVMVAEEVTEDVEREVNVGVEEVDVEANEAVEGVEDGEEETKVEVEE